MPHHTHQNRINEKKKTKNSSIDKGIKQLDMAMEI